MKIYYGEAMNKSIIQLIVRRFFVIALAMLFSYVPASYGASGTSLEKFLTAPSLTSWQNFQADVRSGRYGKKGGLFLKIFEYHDAREKRDLPNSMVLKDITQDEFVILQSKRADSALDFIRKNKNANFWRIIEKLAVQDFDDGLMWTACEIAVRLSPPKFEKIAAEVIKRYPDQSWVIDRIYEKWLPAKKK